MNIFESIDLTNINLHYWNRYIKFIKDIQNKGKRKLQYKEKHHIIPKCINESLFKNKDNIIILTAREHYIAHKILSYCYKPDTNEYNRLMFALFAMSKLKMRYHKREHLINSREYELLRIKYSEARSSYMKEHINDERYETLKGKGQSSYNRGMICITNGIHNKYINKNEIIPEGWHKGCTQAKHDDNWHESLKNAWKRNRKNRTGKNHPMYGKGYLLRGDKNGRFNIKLKYINNGLINKMVKLQDISSYLENGWNLGMLPETSSKNKIAINKNDKVIFINKEDLTKYLAQGWQLGNCHIKNKGNKNPSYGKICVNKDGITKRIFPQELNLYLNTGWIKGMAPRNILKGI